MINKKFVNSIISNLKKSGYFVTETKKVKVDLLALNDKVVLCLQLKKNCRPSKIEMDEFYNISVPENAYKIIVVKMPDGYDISYVGIEPLKDIERKDLFADITGREVFK